MSTGETLRNEGIERVLNNEGISEYRLAVDLVLTRLINEGRPFSANDVQLGLESQLIESHHPATMSAIFSMASRVGRIVRTGDMVRASRPSSHARLYPVWISAKAYDRHLEEKDPQRFIDALRETMEMMDSVKANGDWMEHPGVKFVVEEFDAILAKKR